MDEQGGQRQRPETFQYKNMKTRFQQRKSVLYTENTNQILQHMCRTGFQYFTKEKLREPKKKT